MFTPAPYSPLPSSFPFIILPLDATLCPYGSMVNFSGQGAISGAWTTANTAVAFSFYVGEPTTIYKIGWVNGSSAGGSTDVAIYNSSWARLVSTGATTRTGNNATQWVDVADTALSANTLYYIAMNHSQTNANNVNGILATNVTVNSLTLTGVWQQAVGATALPDPFVPAAPTLARLIPQIYLSTVSAII